MAGRITISQTGCYVIDTENASAVDYIEQIECESGDEFRLKAFHANREVVVKKGPSIKMQADFHLDCTDDVQQFQCVDDSTVEEIDRSHNCGG